MTHSQATNDLNNAGRALKDADAGQVLKDNTVLLFHDLWSTLGALAVMLVGLGLISKKEIKKRMDFISNSVKDI